MFIWSPPLIWACLPPTRRSLSTSSSPLPLPLVSSSRHHHAYRLQLNSSSLLGHWHHCGVANVPEVSEFVLFTPIGQDIHACFPWRNQISSPVMSKLDMCIIFSLSSITTKTTKNTKKLEDNFLRCPWWRTGSVRIAALNSLIKNCVRQCTHILIQPVSY